MEQASFRQGMERFDNIFMNLFNVIPVILLISTVGCQNTSPFEKSVVDAYQNQDMEVTYSYSTWGGVRDDGYSIRVFQFTRIDSLKSIRTNSIDWKHIDWQKTPIKHNHEEAMDIASGYYTKNERLNSCMKEIKNVLQSNNGSYTFICKPGIDFIQNLKLVIIDYSNNKLYIVDAQRNHR